MAKNAKYSIEIDKKSKKFLDKHSDLKSRFNDWVIEAENNPFSEKANEGIVVKLTKGSVKFYKKRIGKYRIIFHIVENQLKVFVIEIGNRSNIYN